MVNLELTKFQTRRETFVLLGAILLASQVSADYSGGPNGDGIATGGTRFGKEEVHRVMMGDWIAQWDTLYSDWFYYNIKTDSSTWIKPKELEHVVFKPPTEKEKKQPKPQPQPQIQQNKNEISSPITRNHKPIAAKKDETERTLRSDDDEFFGFDTSPFSRSFIQQNGIAKSFQTSLTGLYDNIIKDYVTSVFSTAIENYVLATIQIVGWFLVGSFIILSGAVINAGRSFPEYGFGRSFGDSGIVDLNLPFVEGVNMTYPYDISMLTCYQGRNSCIKRDLGGEIDHLVDNFSAVKNFFYAWLELGEKIGHAGIEGDYDELEQISSNNIDIDSIDFE